MLKAPIKSGGTVPRSAAEVMGSRIFWPAVQTNLENIGQLIHFVIAPLMLISPKTTRLLSVGLLRAADAMAMQMGKNQISSSQCH